ncbi:hypothetical protein ILYODFUR_023248 [Ilyodon furcidens]|uniref:Uncharacterized protein n=1 Tax=Ilyodon furcidens TaxID=33524 RepID=A0ABV0V5F9_9TELE
MWLGIVLRKWAGTSLKKMLLQNLDVPFSINGAFTEVPVTHDAVVTNTPPYHHRCWLLPMMPWLLNFALITIQKALYLFVLEDKTLMMSKRNLKCGVVSTLFCFVSVHLRLALVQRSQQRFWVFFVTRLCMVEFNLSM